jgi:hypothetical protein
VVPIGEGPRSEQSREEAYSRDNMTWSAIAEKAFDPYDLRARLFPALLVLTPAIVYLGSTYGAQHPTLALMASIAAACGGPYALASVVRTWGQRAQERLYRRWGALPTTMLLRHRDARLPPPTKRVYHRLIQDKLGIDLPGQAQESADPTAADLAYDAAANALRPLTNDRSKFPCVFKELVAYGFNRNAYGARWAGAAVCILVALAVLFGAGALSMDEPYWNAMRLATLDIASGCTLGVAALLLLMWLFHFTARTVEQAGFGYARRLLETLDAIPSRSNAPAATKRGRASPQPKLDEKK